MVYSHLIISLKPHELQNQPTHSHIPLHRKPIPINHTRILHIPITRRHALIKILHASPPPARLRERKTEVHRLHSCDQVRALKDGLTVCEIAREDRGDGGPVVVVEVCGVCGVESVAGGVIVLGVVVGEVVVAAGEGEGGWCGDVGG